MLSACLWRHASWLNDTSCSAAKVYALIEISHENPIRKNPWVFHVVSTEFHEFSLKPMDDSWSRHHFHGVPWISIEHPWTTHGVHVHFGACVLSVNNFHGKPIYSPSTPCFFSMGYHEFPMGYPWDISVRVHKWIGSTLLGTRWYNFLPPTPTLSPNINDVTFLLF